MSKYLPERIFPLRMARAGQGLCGRIALSKMQRLASSHTTDRGDAQVNLRFERDEAGTPCVHGLVSATLEMTCQRCLGPVLRGVHADVRLGFVTSGEAQELEERYDPVTVDEGPISLTRLVEDELILALPIMVVHEDSECTIEGDRIAEPGLDSESRRSPFAVLSVLKQQPK